MNVNSNPNKLQELFMLKQKLKNSPSANSSSKETNTDRQNTINRIKELENDETLYDVSGDGSFNINDLLVISKGLNVFKDGNINEAKLSNLTKEEEAVFDMDGDGKISAEELNFFKEQGENIIGQFIEDGNFYTDDGKFDLQTISETVGIFSGAGLDSNLFSQFTSELISELNNELDKEDYNNMTLDDISSLHDINTIVFTDKPGKKREADNKLVNQLTQIIKEDPSKLETIDQHELISIFDLVKESKNENKNQIINLLGNQLHTILQDGINLDELKAQEGGINDFMSMYELADSCKDEDKTEMINLLNSELTTIMESGENIATLITEQNDFNAFLNFYATATSTCDDEDNEHIAELFSTQLVSYLETVDPEKLPTLTNIGGINQMIEIAQASDDSKTQAQLEEFVLTIAEATIDGGNFASFSSGASFEDMADLYKLASEKGDKKLSKALIQGITTSLNTKKTDLNKDGKIDINDYIALQQFKDGLDKSALSAKMYRAINKSLKLMENKFKKKGYSIDAETGNYVQTTKSGGKTTRKEFDKTGKPSKVTVTQGSKKTETEYTYDESGRMTGTETSTYDKKGRLKTKKIKLMNADGTYSIETIKYDKNGEVKSTKTVNYNARGKRISS